jgi:hypothetical protein
VAGSRGVPWSSSLLQVLPFRGKRGESTRRIHKQFGIASADPIATQDFTGQEVTRPLGLKSLIIVVVHTVETFFSVMPFYPYPTLLTLGITPGIVHYGGGPDMDELRDGKMVEVRPPPLRHLLLLPLLLLLPRFCYRY